MLNTVLLILPDFCLILLGYILLTRLNFGREFWAQSEKLVFYVLFPPLLFRSVSSANIDVLTAGQFLLVALGAMILAVASAWSVRYFVKADDWTHASVFHCGFRFNTYIGFALCLKLFGDDGFALMALLIAFWVPISNAIAVSVLAAAVAKKEGSKGNVSLTKTVCKAVVQNPLIIATVLGLIFNVLKIQVPDVVSTFLKNLGSASLCMGLLCIGAGLKIQEIQKNLSLISACTLQRLVIVPLIAFVVCWYFKLSALEAGVTILFAGLPTAQSCYVMTANMRGNAPLVAEVTTAQTLMAMVTLPILLLFIAI